MDAKLFMKVVMLSTALLVLALGFLGPASVWASEPKVPPRPRFPVVPAEEPGFAAEEPVFPFGFANFFALRRLLLLEQLLGVRGVGLNVFSPLQLLRLQRLLLLQAPVNVKVVPGLLQPNIEVEIIPFTAIPLIEIEVPGLVPAEFGLAD